MKEFFLSLLKGGQESVSVMRFTFLGTFVCLNATVWGTWAIMTIYRGMYGVEPTAVLAEIPGGVLAAYTTALGIITAGKVGQSIWAEGNGKQGKAQPITEPVAAEDEKNG
ncbi:MAG TPA: hypothetical protein DDY86_00200 [Syntrophaceae bacterium]|nr:hypothetical protein [Syntrophaceae bacterium]